MLESGKLDRLVTFERVTETVAASGAVSRVWTPFMAVRAEVRELRADEVTTGFGEGDRHAVVIVTRWHPNPITTGDRVTVAGRSYDIRQIVELGRRGGWKLSAVAT